MGMAKVLLLLVLFVQIINVLTVSAAARPFKAEAEAGTTIQMVVDMFGDKKQSGSNSHTHCCN
jgi:Na+-transporting methylmalonyl-CoA/oxaloacetate decarboxylase gamma subunit